MHSSQPTTRQPRHSHGPRRGSTSGGSKIAVSPSCDSGYYALLPQHLGPDRLVGPINVRLRIVLLGDEPIHGASTFGLLGVIDGADADPGLLLEILKDRLRKHLVVAHIDNNCWRLRS